MSKPPPPRPSIAPEFAGLGRLASILNRRPGQAATTKAGGDGDEVWTVFGVGTIWQTAAENAARRAGMDLPDWLDQAIRDAARAQGVAVPPKE